MNLKPSLVIFTYKMWNKLKTHCKYGHEFTAANTSICSSGARRCKVCHRAAALKRYHTNTTYRHDAVNRATKRNTLSEQKIIKKNWKVKAKLLKYGLSEQQLNEMCAAQSNCCAICGLPKILCVDHCHITGKIRKLLCHSCNLGIGSFKDNPQLARKAAEYLEQH